jgi:ketosteroid isomerase-like protein
MIRKALVGIALGMTSACVLSGRHSEQPVPRQSPARDSLLAIDLSRNDSLAVRGVPRTMGALLDPGVIYLRAGAHPAYGADPAVRLLESLRREMATFTAWQPIGGGLSRDRLSGYTFGIAIRTQPEQPGAFIERYIAFWTRPRGGSWRIWSYIEVSPGSLSTNPGEKTSPVIGNSPGVRALVSADSQFGEKASALGPAPAMRGVLAEDGVLLTTTQLVVGPRAASDYFESRRAFSISWVPRDARIAASGDLGFTIGDALATSVGPTGAAVQGFTKYLTVWRKDPDGRWRVVVTGANDRPSPIGN